MPFIIYSNWKSHRSKFERLVLDLNLFLFGALHKFPDADLEILKSCQHPLFSILTLLCFSVGPWIFLM